MSAPLAGPRLEDLALHDATLVAVVVGWEAATCAAEVRGLVRPGWLGARLRWSGVTAFEFARREPWGPSVSVLEVRRGTDGWGELLLQSGDALRVRAGALHVEPLAPAG